jgi:hypothetical protein
MSKQESKGFYDLNDSELTFIPFDIETTGFKSADDDFVTNVVMFHQGNYHIWINTNGNEENASEMRKDIIAGSELDNIVLYVCETERELLLNIGDYLESQADNNTILTAFNGETRRGDNDFDVPFLRTRCFRNGVGWILDGFWYCDTYQVLGDKTRFDTTIKDEASLEDMEKPDLKTFVDDMNFDINYDKMSKAELVHKVDNHSNVTADALERWGNDNIYDMDKRDPDDPDSFTKSHLMDFIDTNSLDIQYDNLTKDEIIREIREQKGFSQQALVSWHKDTGLSIGTKQATKLDTFHEAMVEDMMYDEEWQRELSFDIEVFEPFDPFDDSGEAVTEYRNDNFVGVILHCFADVARTVNLTRMMLEYTPKKDYSPKVL